ncbi:LOW QUALITY PROTEIN: protein phosphatase 2C-like domain-containing protein 1 [Sceloporus undulatus]|uniref:LOW QUALITY PROTEIN: protein phosphatase 2C-like domain-containing protein 1 n=1 Tax=Sceloporus undulatus TaxID=8520 RepID=UPI001C4CB30E|nr:LOW QUALITY PROTEIN: protein phosphatase 2C-like domain-containing protein 1 [Sceloporus undulatus]
MTYQTGSQNSKPYKAEEDLTKAVNIDFRKVGHLDITVCCSICDEPVNIRHLFHHKKAHQAQAVLGYQRAWMDPTDIQEIDLQRKQLISRMRKIAKYPEREREKIDCSFNFLKETLKTAPYFCIKSVAQSSVQIKVVSNPLIKAIAICQDKNAFWHQDLEDVFVVTDNYGNRKGTCFIGLFDGANGISAAQTTSAELPLLLLDQLSRGDSSYEVGQSEKKVLDSFRTIFRPDYKLRENIFTARRVKRKRFGSKTHEWIHRAYAKSFWRMDRLLRLGRNETSRVCWSSCTAVTCLLETLSSEKQQQDEGGKKRFGSITTEKLQNATEQEELSEMITGTKRKSNTKEETDSTTEQPVERRDEEEEQIIIQEEEKQVPEEINERTKKISIEQGMGKIPEQQREEPLGNMNGKKNENAIQEEEELLPERITGAKIKSITGQDSITNYQKEEPNERINEETKEQNAIQQEEELPERIIQEITSKMEHKISNSIVDHLRNESIDRINANKEEQDVIPQEEQEETEQPEWTVEGKEKSTMEEKQEEPCEMHDQMTKTGETEQSINDEDGIQEEDLFENNQSSDEASVGLIHIANIGNVHAVLCKNGKSYWVTKEHTTYSRKEKLRVIRNGGQISSNEPKGLIEGLIKNTRGLGHHGNPQLKKTVIPVPHTISFPVDDSCQFLILATSGLWEVLDKKEVVLLALTMFSAYLENYHYIQLKKNCPSKDSKCSLNDLEDEFYLWYSNQDFFPDKDKNLGENNNAQVLPPINSGTKEETLSQARSFRSNSEDEESESSLEPPSFETSSEDTTKREESTEGSGIPGVPSQRFDNESDETSQTSETSGGNSWTFYDLAAKYISKHLVKAALKAGSRDNITVLVVLLNGCDKIPTYVYHV